MYCKVCAQPATPFSSATLLGKYDVQYYRCSSCGFIQTESPYWLEEAYAEPIAATDIGMVSRNLSLAKKTRALIPVFFDSRARFLDFGGGYGLFVRLMRDAGFDFYRLDRLCPNLFAAGFNGYETQQGEYELVTAFEVFEHFEDPLDEISGVLRFSDNLLFTTLLIPPHNPRPGEWWYYGLEHGQHVSFFSARALAEVGKRLSLKLVSDGKFLHLLTKKRISPILFKIVLYPKVTTALALLLRRRSMLSQDFFGLTGRALE